MDFSEIGIVAVIDDDPIIATVAEAYFLSRGVTNVVSASNGQEALSLFDGDCNKIDLILCDLNMPQMDGAEFFRHLAELEFANPIIILSGEDKSIVSLAAVLAKTHRLNLTTALHKPLDTKALDDAINQAAFNVFDEEPKQNRPSLKPEDLENAIATGQIGVFYQPKVDVGTGAVVGVEALARWNHPEHGVVGPDEFIPLAAQANLMEQLSDTVFAKAIDDTRHFRKLGNYWCTALNVDPSLLSDVTFPNKIIAQVSDAGLAPSDFTLEITEVGPIEKNASAIEVLVRLRMSGFGLSIDDFGKEFSNIDYLRDFPFTEIKIDRSFVEGLPNDDRARASVRAIASLSHDIGLRLVAEGVETAEQWRFVLSEGIDQVQGYFVARPMTFEDLQRWRLEYRRLDTNLSAVLAEENTSLGATASG